MGRRGPKPKPTALKLAAGNPGKRPLNLQEAVPAEGELDKPDWLDPGASEIWDALVPMLREAKLVRPIDSNVVVQYCVAWSRFRTASEKISGGDTTFEIYGEEGQLLAIKEIPEMAEMRKLQQTLVVLSRELGLTPSARSSIKADVTPAKDQADLKNRFFGAA